MMKSDANSLILKVDTDITAFENELKRFAAQYVQYRREADLLDIQVFEPLWPDRQARDTGSQPVERGEGRTWMINLRRQDKSEIGSADAPDVHIAVSRIGGEYPLLVEFGPCAEDARPFLVAFVDKCKRLWRTSRPSTSDASEFADKSSRVKLVDGVLDAFEIALMKSAANGPLVNSQGKEAVKAGAADTAQPTPSVALGGGQREPSKQAQPQSEQVLIKTASGAYVIAALPASVYIEKIESLENILLARATGQGAYEDENNYRTLREELIQDEYIKPLLPRFVRSNRRLSQFWEYIKAKFGTYKERREYIGAEFAPLLNGLESRNLSYASDEDIKSSPLVPLSATERAETKRLDSTSEEIQTGIDRAKLRQNLAKHFDKEELRTLCFDLDIEYENLPETKDGMARELVRHCDRHDRIPQLVQKCRELYPNVSWE